MVSSPTVSTSSIDLSLKVREWTAFDNVNSLCSHINVSFLPLSPLSLPYRVNFTTSGSIRSLLSPLQLSLFPPRSTTCYTLECLPSPLTLQHLFMTKPGPSASTSLMTWWASFSWFLDVRYLFSRCRTELQLYRSVCHNRSLKALPSDSTPKHLEPSSHRWRHIALILQETQSPSVIFQLYHCVFSVNQALPRPDDETAGEDGKNSCHHFWTQ